MIFSSSVTDATAIDTFSGFDDNLTVSCNPASLRSIARTEAPSATRRKTAARLIPDPPPVIIAVLSLNRSGTILEVL